MPDSRPWQRMLSTRKLNLDDPQWTDVEISDIAHGLSRVARWNGQTIGEWAYSVAQHSLLVERLYTLSPARTRRDVQMIALLHDAPEYVIGDLISPFKARMGDQYKETEDRIFRTILQKVGLLDAFSAETMKAVKRVDRAAAFLEAVNLALFETDEARAFFRPQPWAIAAFEAGEISLEPLRPNDAKTAFLTRYNALAVDLDLPQIDAAAA